jgi:hypothetical protein
MTRTYSRDPRTQPWLYAEHIAGFLLGLALAAMAVDHGMSNPTPSSSLPLTPVRTTGP